MSEQLPTAFQFFKIYYVKGFTKSLGILNKLPISK